METISIVFSKSSGTFPIFSWLIMAAEQTPYSHVSIKMMDDEISQPVIYQASHTMVNEMSETEFLSQETVVYSFDFQVSPAVKQNIKKFAINQLGVSYGILSIIGLAYVQIVAWFGKKIDNPFKENGQTYVCSQFIASVLEACTNVSISEPINDITPKDMYGIVKNFPATLS